MLESKDAVLVATSLALTVSTVVSVSIELERQATAVGRLTASKWLLVISAFFALVFTSIICTAAAKGLGASISATEFAHRETLQKLIVAAFPPYLLCNMFVKHAWLTFYYGLSRTRAQRYFIHAMQIIAASFGISSTIVILTQCIPLNAVWRRNLDPRTEHSSARCINLMSFFYYNAAFMIVNDVVMYLIPMVLLWKVDMIRDHRWSLYALFGMCFLVILASIFRLIAVYEVDTSPNVSQNYALVFLWAAVENHVGICAACAGALKARCCVTYKKVRKMSMDLRNKSWLASVSAATSTDITRTQSSEERILYDRADSNAPSLNDVSIEDKSPDLRMELVEMHAGAPFEVLKPQQPKLVTVRYSSSS